MSLNVRKRRLKKIENYVKKSKCFSYAQPSSLSSGNMAEAKKSFLEKSNFMDIELNYPSFYSIYTFNEIYT